MFAKSPVSIPTLASVQQALLASTARQRSLPALTTRVSTAVFASWTATVVSCAHVHPASPELPARRVLTPAPRTHAWTVALVLSLAMDSLACVHHSTLEPTVKFVWPSLNIWKIVNIIFKNFFEIVTSVCSVNPCQNGGVCQVTGTNSYICNCPVGYTGTICQTCKLISPLTHIKNEPFYFEKLWTRFSQ